MTNFSYDFSNFAEKYNERLNTWDEVMVAIKMGHIYFYDRKSSPKNQTDRSVPKLDDFLIEKCQIAIYKQYQIRNQVKKNVIFFRLNEANMIISFKNEMHMNMCHETMLLSTSKKNNQTQLSHRKMTTVQKKVVSKIKKDNSKGNINQLNKNQSTNNLLSRPKFEQLKKPLKEENKPLNSLINDLLSSASQNRDMTFRLNDEEHDTSRSISKKKNQLNKIIQLSLKKTSEELLSSSISLISAPLSPNQTTTHQNPLHYDLEGSLDEGLVNSSFYTNNNNSFSLPQPLVSCEKIQNLVNKIENYEIFIYDSYIIKKLIKDNSLTKEDFGKIYSLVNNECLKCRLLIEMVAICSKRRLNKSIQQKQPNEKCEAFILEVFNTFLGNNIESSYLYDKVLPGELNDIFQIDIILDIKSQISLSNLFIVMEYRNRIYFNDNLDVNFLNPSPFVEQDIKYISPYLIFKWGKHSISQTQPSSMSNITISNIKRMSIDQQLSSTRMYKDNEEMKSFKEYELMNDETRINLVMDIYQLIYQKKYELSLKLCDYYVQKYTDSIFLNPIVYLILLEIYNQTIGIDLAKLFFDKCCYILSWLYPNNSCHLIIDVYYTYSLMLMKQSENYIDENLSYILDIITRAKDLSEIFYEMTNEKYIKIHLQYHLFNYLYKKKHLPFDDIVSGICSLQSSEYSTKEVYLRLFIDCLEGDLDNRITKLNLRQVLISMRKEKTITT